ncbi:MAG: MaoC family dehydratase N-terminal domain-containing protein [Acidimicrobiia bacterium]|nr:MaoC family dehydratase N-terminal domain-containing protein [Acidimicrobiia bacterium]
MSDTTEDEFLADLQATVGASGTPQVARDPVNEATIRDWCDAMGEANPLFTDWEAAQAGPHGGLVAPPAMLNVWTMAGLHLGRRPTRDPRDPNAGAYGKLDAAGFTSVVATNSEQVYHRYLRPGDLLTGTQKLVDVSPEKKTGLGIGHFVTTETEYHDQHGEHVGSLFFRILKFRPGTGRGKPPDPRREKLLEMRLDADAILDTGPRPQRPRPKFNQDQAWFWEGLRKNELRIQRFTDTGRLVHPPANANPATGAMDYDWVVASGRATLYSYAVPHHPEVPSFDYPLVVGLVELEEGVRLVTNIVGCAPDQLEIGMPLQLGFVDTHDDVTLHQFHPAAPPRTEHARSFDDVAEGDALPLTAIPLDPLLIVSTALATRDFQDVHHDRDAAVKKGSKDIFMNILTTSGICNRWIGDWAGDAAVFKNLKIQLGAPNYPYDLMSLTGSVTGTRVEDDEGIVELGFVGKNKLGAHVTGTAELALPRKGA